jgi:hypothetical protein
MLYHPVRGSAAPRSNFRGSRRYSNVLGYKSSRDGTLVVKIPSRDVEYVSKDKIFTSSSLSVADDDDDGKEINIKCANSHCTR